MTHRNDTRIHTRELVPRVGRAKARDQPEAVPVLDVVEESLAVRDGGALIILTRREAAVAAEVLGGVGVAPCDCAGRELLYFQQS